MKVVLIKIILFIRSLTQQKRTPPDFFVVGAQKGGTSSLYSYLIQHPNIISALKKEVHYFESPQNRKQGLKWYLNHFPTTRQKNRKNAITGEGTPFMYSYHGPKLVHNIAPKAKLIFVLRDPVSRAFSHYKHNTRRKGRETLSFSEAIRTENDRISEDIEKSIEDEWYDDRLNRMYSYVDRGLYFEQINRWLQYFPKEQMLVVKSEDFFSDPKTTLKLVINFLELKDFTFDVSYQSNTGNYQDSILPEDVKYLESIYQKPNEDLYSITLRRFW